MRIEIVPKSSRGILIPMTPIFFFIRYDEYIQKGTKENNLKARGREDTNKSIWLDIASSTLRQVQIQEPSSLGMQK